MEEGFIENILFKENEHPFNIFGFGIIAYTNLLRQVIRIFMIFGVVFMLIMAAYKYYRHHEIKLSNLFAPVELIKDLTLGHLSRAQTKCR